MRLALDSCVLGILCHDRHPDNADLRAWMLDCLSDATTEVYIPAIADYELRRKLLHLMLRNQQTQSRSIQRLDGLRSTLSFLALDDSALQRAANLWAQARRAGQPTSPDEALDGDVLIAAQALGVGAAVVTENRQHLSRYCTVEDWRA